MDCCYFITSINTCLVLLFGTSFATLCVYLIKFLQWKSNSNTYSALSLPEQADDVKGIVCQSKSCVRCSYNVFVLQNTRDQFMDYFKTNTNEELHRLRDSIFSNDNVTSPSGQNRYTLHLTGLSSSVWFDPKLTYRCDVEKLENNYLEILNEFCKVNDEDGWIVNEKQEGCWRVFHLVCQGRIIETNASRCPKTMNVIRNMDYVMSDTVFGYITFSIMEPGTVIKPHYGSTNCRLRCHLGLQVNPNTCYIEVAGQRKSWKAGKCLMFDDSFLHSACHNGTKWSNFRAILMVDMWHPGLNEAEIDCISTIYTADVMPKLSILH